MAWSSSRLHEPVAPPLVGPDLPPHLQLDEAHANVVRALVRRPGRILGGGRAAAVRGPRLLEVPVGEHGRGRGVAAVVGFNRKLGEVHRRRRAAVVALAVLEVDEADRLAVLLLVVAEGAAPVARHLQHLVVEQPLARRRALRRRHVVQPEHARHLRVGQQLFGVGLLGGLWLRVRRQRVVRWGEGVACTRRHSRGRHGSPWRAAIGCLCPSRCKSLAGSWGALTPRARPALGGAGRGERPGAGRQGTAFRRLASPGKVGPGWQKKSCCLR